jgi:hypothetical protein
VAAAPGPVVLHVSLAHRAGKPEPRRAPTLVPGENGIDGFARYGLRVPFALISPGLAQPLAVADLSALSCSVTGPGTIPPPGSVTG